MGLREAVKKGKSTVKKHSATIKLRGEDTDLNFMEPTAGALDHLQGYTHIVSSSAIGEDGKKTTEFLPDLNKSNMIKYNTAVIAFTLLGSDDTLEFRGKTLDDSVKECGKFLYGKDESGEKAFSNAEIEDIAKEAQVVLGHVKTVEDQAKN